MRPESALSPHRTASKARRMCQSCSPILWENSTRRLEKPHSLSYHPKTLT